MKVVFGHIEHKTPARYYYDTNTLFINQPVFNQFSRLAQKFIVLHEVGHSIGIMDELKADEYAFEQIVKGEHSLKATVEALVKALPFSSDESRARIIAQYNRAAKFDRENNNNLKAMEIPNIEHEQEQPYDAYGQSIAFAGAKSDFLGLGKKAQARRDEKQEAKNAVKLAKAEAIKNGTYQTGAGKFLSGALDMGKKFLGVEEAIESPNAQINPEVNKPAANNKTYIIIAVVVIVVAIVVYFGFIKGKSKK